MFLFKSNKDIIELSLLLGVEGVHKDILYLIVIQSLGQIVKGVRL